MHEPEDTIPGLAQGPIHVWPQIHLPIRQLQEQKSRAMTRKINAVQDLELIAFLNQRHAMR